MSIIGWIILGLIAGFIASKIVNKEGEGFFLDIVLDLPRFRGEMRAWDQALWLYVMLSSGFVAFFGSAPGGPSDGGTPVGRLVCSWTSGLLEHKWSGVHKTGATSVAKDFLKYLIQPKICNEYLKTGLGRRVPAMPSLVKSDPWWMADPHRKAYTTQSLLRPTVPVFWAYNPAYADVQNEHV
jgi:hypothetical protein